jgi:glycosyltransferase involved in cell wall biosynthesis
MTSSGPTPGLSVVIPTRNRPATLLRAVRALRHETREHGLEVEIVVADDASEAPAADVLAAEFVDAAHVVRLPHRAGPAGARNAAVECSRGEVLAFLDDDIVPAPTYLRETLAFHRRHPQILVVNGNLRPLRDDPYSRFWFHHYDAAFNRPGETYPVSMLGSGHCSIKRRLLELERPLFDPALRTGEDVDLYLRLSRRGVAVYKCDRILAFNDCRRSFAAFLRQRAGYAEGQERLVAKHGAEAVAQLRRRLRAPPNWRLAHLSLALRLMRGALRVQRGAKRLWTQREAVR